MSEERFARMEGYIIEQGQKISSLQTLTEQHVNNQEKYNEKICRLIDKQDKRIDSLEGTRRTLFGIAIGSGGLTGFSISSLFKIFGQ